MSNTCLLGRNEQDTSHKLCLCGSLIGNHVLLSKIYLYQSRTPIIKFIFHTSTFCTERNNIRELKSYGPKFIELLKQKILLNNCLLSRNEQDTSHNFEVLYQTLGQWLATQSREQCPLGVGHLSSNSSSTLLSFVYRKEQLHQSA